MPVTADSSGLAGDLLSSPRCRELIESITSCAVMVLPLWNSTPLRSLKVQTLASGEASQLSASSPTSLPELSISVR
jgi:hypothetical protein